MLQIDLLIPASLAPTTSSQHPSPKLLECCSLFRMPPCVILGAAVSTKELGSCLSLSYLTPQNLRSSLEEAMLSLALAQALIIILSHCYTLLTKHQLCLQEPSVLASGSLLPLCM